MELLLEHNFLAPYAPQSALFWGCIDLSVEVRMFTLFMHDSSEMQQTIKRLSSLSSLHSLL